MNKIYSIKKVIPVTTLFIIIAFVFSTILSMFIQENNSEKRIMTNTIKNEKLDSVFHNAIDSIPITGLSVEVTKKKETIYSMQYGEGIDAHSSFILGSTSKAITAAAILTIISEYGLELTDSVNKYLPWLRGDITLLDLLNHTSGISTYEQMDNLRYLGKYGEFEYSNTNYNILGEVIEVVTKDTFSHYIEKNIFNELNMPHSFALSGKTSNQIVRGYQSYFGIPVPRKPQLPSKSTWIQAPSGYLCSSTSDMVEYLQFMLEYSHDSVPLLQFIKSKGTVANDNAAINGIYGNTGLYGFGWIYKYVNDTEILYHTGKTSSFTSISVLIPEENITITVFFIYNADYPACCIGLATSIQYIYQL